jgi:hypothetical protein
MKYVRHRDKYHIFSPKIVNLIQIEIRRIVVSSSWEGSGKGEGRTG